MLMIIIRLTAKLQGAFSQGLRACTGAHRCPLHVKGSVILDLPTCNCRLLSFLTLKCRSVIPVHSRARGSSLQILLGHALGDVISIILVYTWPSKP